MAKFNMGYPNMTGDAEKDIEILYDFICEMVDRLSYAFNAMEKLSGRQNTADSE